MSAILVTGSASVAGRALLEHLHGDPEFRDRRFVLAGLHGEGALRADFSAPSRIEGLVQAARKEGPYSAAALVAGVNMDQSVATLSEETWDRVWDINYRVHSRLLKELPFEPGAALVFVSSIVGFRGNAGQTAYAAAKGALELLCRAASARGLRANVLLPPLMESPLLANLSAEAKERLFSSRLMPDPSPQASFAQAAAFLLSKRSSYVQGQVFHADSRVTALGWDV